MFTLITLRNLRRFYRNIKNRLELLYYNKIEVNQLIESAISHVYRYKGNVNTYTELLQKTGMIIGDVWNVIQADPSHDVSAGDNFAWNGTAWDNLHGIIDLSNYYTKGETDDIIDDVLADAQQKLQEAKNYTDTLVEEERQKALEDLEEAKELLNTKIEEAKVRLSEAEDLIDDARTRLSTAETNIGSLQIWKNEAQGELDIFAEYIDTNNQRVSQCELDINAAEATIGLHTQNIDALNEVVTQAGIDIDGIESTLTLYAHYLNPNTGELKDAIIKVDGQNATIQNYCAEIKDNSASISTLTQTAASLTSRIQNTEGNVSTLQQTATSFNTRISSVETGFSSISQTVNNISLTVGGLEEGSNYAAIVAKINEDDTSEVIIKADHIELLGSVIAQKLTTNKLTAAQIDVANINVSAFKGNLSASRVDGFDNAVEKYLEDHPITAGDTVQITDSQPVNGIVTRLIKVTHDGVTTNHTEYWSDAYVLTDIGIGSQSSGHNTNYVKISRQGLLTADNAIIYGSIYASAGYFGELYIDGNNISVGNVSASSANTYFDENGILHCNGADLAGSLNAESISTNSGKFTVDSNGILTATGADITGDIKATNLQIVNLTETNNLIVSQLKTSSTGKRVEIANNVISVKDVNNIEKVNISGDNIVPAGQGITFNISPKYFIGSSSNPLSLPKSLFESTYTIENIDIYTSSQFHCDGNATLKTCDYIRGYMTAVYNSQSYLQPELQIRLILENVDSGETIDIAYYQDDIMCPPNSSSDCDFYCDRQSGYSEYSLSEGNYRLKLIGLLDLPIFSYEILSSDIKITLRTRDTLVMDMQYNTVGTVIGANGFRTMLGSNYKAEFITDVTTSESSFIIQAGNYAIKITNTGLKKTTNGGSSWTDI